MRDIFTMIVFVLVIFGPAMVANASLRASIKDEDSNDVKF